MALRDAAAEAQQQTAQLPKQKAFRPALTRLGAAAQARALKARQAVARRPAGPALRPEVQQRVWLQPEPEAPAQDEPVAPQLLPSFA